MHVGLNLVYLVPGETGGMETYARELLPALVAARPNLRLTAFINEETRESREGPWFDLIPSVTVPVRARRRTEWVRGEQQMLPRLASRAGVEVLHSLASTAPARGRFRRVVTVHDLIYRLYPEAHGRIRALGMAAVVPLAVRRSHRIIVPSSTTREDLIEAFGVDATRIDTVPEGVSPPRAGSLDEGEVRRRFDLGTRRLVLTASAKRPHKNLLRLLEALALIPSSGRPVLVLPGYPTPHEADLRRRAAELGLDEYTRFAGWVDAGTLESLYRTASCFVFPSLYEGFGLPILEAMARGLPVVCSYRGSLREVAGDAALELDPDDPRSIAGGIEQLLGNPEQAEALRRAGLERAARFTWASTAAGTLESYDRATRS